MSAGAHNRVLEAARARADEVEPRLTAIVERTLRAAGREAARNFSAKAVDFLTASPPGLTATHAMVTLYPSPEQAQALAREGGEAPEILHATLCFLGEYDGLLAEVADALRPVAAAHAPLVGAVGGAGAFFAAEGAPTPLIALPDVPGLGELRHAVVTALHAAEIDYSREHGFSPHVTLAYSENGQTVPTDDLAGQPLSFDAVHIVRGNAETITLPLTGMPAVTAGAIVAESETGAEIGAVADRHDPKETGGYGAAAWNESEGKVFWVSADWTSNEEVDAAEADFLAIDGVVEVESCAECPLPDGEDWEVAYRPGALGPVEEEAMLASADQPGPPRWAAPSASEVLDVEALVASLRAKTDPVRRALAERVMRETVEGAGVSFEVTNPLAGEALAKVGAHITQIGEETQALVMRTIRASYEQGLSVPDTAKVIRETMDGSALTRAVTIARTELVGAVNGASFAGMRVVVGATGDAYEKRWLTAEGAPHPRHEDYPDLNGQTVGMNETFDVGGSPLAFPGDPDGDPGEVINCRCAMVWVEPGGGETEAETEES